MRALLLALAVCFVGCGKGDSALLTDCKACGKSISIEAERCPSCGHLTNFKRIADLKKLIETVKAEAVSGEMSVDDAKRFIEDASKELEKLED